MKPLKIHCLGESLRRVLAHSLSIYLICLRHSLIKQLAIRLSQQAGKSLVMCGFLRFTPKKEF